MAFVHEPGRRRRLGARALLDLARRRSAGSLDLELHPEEQIIDAEVMQVGIFPAHRRLQHSMHLVESGAPRHKEASPDHRLHSVKNDPQLQHRMSGRGGHGRSLRVSPPEIVALKCGKRFVNAQVHAAPVVAANWLESEDLVERTGVFVDGIDGYEPRGCVLSRSV
jgi:hypothetical protein